MKENRKMHIDLRDVESIMVNLTWFCSCFAIAHFFILMAYNIRLISIREFGTVIHEFDPYFNFRATEVRKLTTVMIVALLLLLFSFLNYSVCALFKLILLYISFFYIVVSAQPWI